jgi:hypothetical protein
LVKVVLWFVRKRIHGKVFILHEFGSTIGKSLAVSTFRSEMSNCPYIFVSFSHPLLPFG